MQSVRNIGDSSTILTVPLVAPLQCFKVKIGYVTKDPICQKVCLYISYKTFDLSFGKRVAGLAQFCFKPDGIHKHFIVFLPYRMPVLVSSNNNTLHVICQNILRYSHIFEGVEHADKQILLFGIRKELDIPFSAMVADHSKTSCSIVSARTVLHMYEAPVHLIGFAGSGLISSSAIALT